MAYVISAIWRCWKLKIACRRLEKARQNTTHRQNVGAKKERPGNKFRKLTFKRCIDQCLYPITLANISEKRKIQMSHAMLYLNCIIGFLSGLLLTFVIYFFGIYQLSFNETTAIYTCIPLSVFLSFGLAFSKRCRCVMLLAAPQIFTGKGRVALMAYIFIVVNNGPLRNSLDNFQILVNSTICLQDTVTSLLPPVVANQLQTNSVDGSPKDFSDILDAGKEKLNQTVVKFRMAYKAMETLYNETWNDLDKQYGWLKDKQALCMKLKRRITFFIHDLTSRLFQSWVVMILAPWLPLFIQQTAKKIISEGFKVACSYDEDDAAFFLIKNVMRKRLDDIKMHVENEADFNISFVHYYSYNLNQSKSFDQIQKAVLVDVKESFKWMAHVLNFLNVISSGFFLFIFIKSIMYYRKYSQSPRYDNFYISSEFEKLDYRRQLLGFPKLLPLRRRERRHFISTYSLTMTRQERQKFFKSFLLLVISSGSVIYIMILDFGIHWFSTILCTYGEITINIQGPLLPQPVIRGGGVISSVFRGIAEAFEPFLKFYIPPIDLSTCLPKTESPEYSTYMRIGRLLFLAFFSTYVGAYGLRLRHIIAAHYNPRMERPRAIWLHRKILVQRKFRRKRAFLKHPFGIFSALLEYISFRVPLIGRLLRTMGYHSFYCYICGEKIDENDKFSFERCQNVGCQGIYCTKCLKEVRNVCQRCNKPINYQKYTFDFSDEIDSSDEELAALRREQLGNMRTDRPGNDEPARDVQAGYDSENSSYNSFSDD